MKAVFQSLETALPQRESSSLILRLTLHWRWCNSMKVINHLPKLRPHLSRSLWAPKLLLRASDGCLVRGCSSPLRQVKPALTFTLLSLASYSHRTHSPDNIIQFLIMYVCVCVCVCVCVAGDSPGLEEKTEAALIRSDFTQPLQATKLPPFIHGAFTSTLHRHTHRSTH